MSVYIDGDDALATDQLYINNAYNGNSTSNANISETPLNKNPYNYIKQIADYLFEVQYSTENVDYTYANNYFKKLPPQQNNAPACTGIVKNGKVLRQLDWYYNDGAEFIVRRVADVEKGIHASIGVAASIKDLTKEIVESGTYNRKFKMVPFIMTDGINDAGLYIQSNVVQSLEGGFDLNPTATEECCITMAIRYMLDHCANFTEVENFFNTVHIYNTSAVTYTYHFLLAQGNNWEVIEITSNGHTVVTQGTGTNQMPHGIMTNFRTTGLVFSDDELNWNSVETYGIGVERYDLATLAFANENLRTLEQLRTDLKYTNAYSTSIETKWYTEYCDPKNANLTVMNAKNAPEYFFDVYNEGVSKYIEKSRYTKPQPIWQTVHSAIYDLSNKSFNIAIQERMDETYNFSLDEPNNFILIKASDDETKTMKISVASNGTITATQYNP